MNASLIASRKMTFTVGTPGDQLRVIVEVWKIPPPKDVQFPDGIKFSIVAFLEKNPGDNIVVDCHPPKGPHFHYEGKEFSFEWKGLEAAEKMFWELVEKKFGMVKEH